MQRHIEITAAGKLFRLDLEARHLYLERHTKVPLTRQQWNLLELFLKSPGVLVSKNDLVDRLWGGKFITDDAITRAVSSLRKALGDDADDPQFIETSFGFGYRFIAEVSNFESSAGESVGNPAISEASTASEWASILQSGKDINSFTKRIGSPDDLGILESYIKQPSHPTLIQNVLLTLGRLATGWDGRIIKRMETCDVVKRLYSSTASLNLRANAATTLACLGTNTSRKFLADHLDAMEPAVLAATLGVWGREIAYWDDVEYWRAQIARALITWISKPLQACLFIEPDGKENDCRWSVFLVVGELKIVEAEKAIEEHIARAESPVRCQIEAAGAHWRITRSEKFLPVIEAGVRTNAFADAKRWIEEIRLSKLPRVSITERQDMHGMESVKGTFVRDEGFEFEVFLEPGPTPDTFRTTRISEMYISADGVVQWSWHSLNKKEIDWSYGRILLADLLEGLCDLREL